MKQTAGIQHSFYRRSTARPVSVKRRTGFRKGHRKFSSLLLPMDFEYVEIDGVRFERRPDQSSQELQGEQPRTTSRLAI